MSEYDNYFRITKSGSIHTVSDRIPFRWKELLIWTSAPLALLIIFFGWIIGLFVAFLTLVCYSIFRFAAWFYYSEIQIDEKSGKMIRLTKILDRTRKVDLITDKFDPSNFQYTELNRSGKKKFLMNYRTHKNNELLIIKSQTDKELIEKYINENITVYNNGYNLSLRSNTK